MSKCSTLANSYISLVSLRAIHWLPLLLCTIWALSPLGSQAALRFMEVRDRMVTTPASQPVQYIFPATSHSTACSTCESRVNSANSLLLASLLSVVTTGTKPQDSWGNLKIPVLEMLDSSINANDWYTLDPHFGSEYSSLLGIPFNRPTGRGNLTFTLDTWYWNLINPVITTSYQQNAIFQNLSDKYTSFTSRNYLYRFITTTNFSIATNEVLPLVFEQNS